MTYRFTGKDKNGTAVEPLPGLPLEADDKTFREAVDAYEAQFEDRVVRDADGKVVETVAAKGSVMRSGMYEHTPDAKAKDEKAAPAEEGN